MEGCYPKWLYHAEKAAVIVKDKASHEAMGPEWAESPADVVKPVHCAKDCAAPVDEEVKPARRRKASQGGDKA